VKKNISQTLTLNRKCCLSNIVKQKHKLQVSNIRYNIYKLHFMYVCNISITIFFLCRLKNTMQKIINNLENLQKKMENITLIIYYLMQI